MAHKSLKGVRAAKKSSLKKHFKKDKEKKRLKAEQKAKQAEGNELAGLRKWQKKAIRAEKLAESKAKAEAKAPEKNRDLDEAKVAPSNEGGTVVSQKEKKLAKKEARIQAGQIRAHRQLYSQGRVLLVGEGNFSFARALCEVRGSGEGIYASALDGEATLQRKYPNALQLRRTVEEKGGTALLNVDATKLHKVREFRDAFQIICWNFPHLGAGEKDLEKNNEQHRKLLGAFFASALRCLDEQGAVHVAMKHGEPYKSWKVVQVAKAATDGALCLQRVISFSVAAWPGYEHRRTRGFHERFSKKDSEELAKGAKVYVFVRSGDEDGLADVEDA